MSGEAGKFVERFQNAKSPFANELGRIDPRTDRVGLAKHPPSKAKWDKTTYDSNFGCGVPSVVTLQRTPEAGTKRVIEVAMDRQTTPVKNPTFRSATQYKQEYFHAFPPNFQLLI